MAIKKEAPPVRSGRGRRSNTSRGDAVASGRTILPGEPGQDKPNRPGTKPRPMPTEPNPSVRYNAMKKAVRTKGMQPGEKEQLQRIAENRGVDMKQARKIAINRTAKGLSLKGLSGPNGNPNSKEPGRKNVKNPKPIGRMPIKPGGPGPTPPSGENAPTTPVGSRSFGGRGKAMPKVPTRTPRTKVSKSSTVKMGR